MNSDRDNGYSIFKDEDSNHMTFCDTCMTVYVDGGAVDRFQRKCPKLYCKQGILVRFEENIAPVAYQLYKKGYRFILNACSGHAHKPDSALVIEFAENALIDDCPQGFEIVHGEHSSIICKHIETTDMRKKQIELFKAIAQLSAWVDSLEDYYTGEN